ncbi:MAG TPA: MFS transporter, partial [bacterium]|nr:MFS transporter [bacterium]
MTATDSGKKEAGGSSALKSLVYVSGQFGGNLPNLIFSGWVLYFYTNDEGRAQPLISMYIMGAALICGRIVDALADPLIGFWSDKTHTRIGRRRPFILIGAPLMVGSFILLFRPMFPAGSAALVVSTIVIMGLFWFFFTAVMGPYLSLMPELAETSKQRVGLTTYMAVAFLIANAYQGF